MDTNAQYEAAWVPGLNDDIDQDDSLGVALDWLGDAERRLGGSGIIVMYAKSMMDNDPLLSKASTRWEFVSRLSHRPRGVGPVLAVWPPEAKLLEFAESLARRSALCVVAGSYEITGWIQRSGAECLVEGFEPSGHQQLAPAVRARLDSMVSFGGHNGFLGNAKEQTIRDLQFVARSAAPPSPEQLETYLLSAPGTRAKGIARARRWYEEIVEGKRHRDYAGRIIGT